MVGLLEDLIGADPGLPDDAIALDIQGGGVDVDAADLPLPAPRAVDRAYRLGDEAGVVLGMLAEDQDQSLVAAILERLDLPADLGVIERPPHGLAVRPPEAAVGAIVDAEIADVQRCE